MPKVNKECSLYLAAVKWIAFNDDDGAVYALDKQSVSEMVSVCLVSDVFGVKRKTVARHVIMFRKERDNAASKVRI